MTIDTKLNINEAIHFIHEQRAIQSIVQQILIHIEAEVDIVYLCNNEAGKNVNIKVPEKYAFKSKNDLIKSL